jgi:hypothetical protein
MVVIIPFFSYKKIKKKSYGASIFLKIAKSRDADLVTFWNGRLLP